MNIFSEYTIKIKDLVNKLNSDNKLELPDNLDGINIDIPPKGFTGDISCNVALVLSNNNFTAAYRRGAPMPCGAGSSY